ncbi:formylglycine-generating enzyme family protein [Actomonas aquatica]|uniref:Formylglycine-generating enzyme family protein n=1 Tax=Actomonas aquatica TaxID=2866162 RepID=A0ABZ1C4V8_9BACT|nr:formylglycine-generating enzyme family protein [Opitutus sp. WL0086]WRQ86541.1 formylglycine-generating enzyme family protein [Opitutus sp. WL0086]
MTSHRHLALLALVLVGAPVRATDGAERDQVLVPAGEFAPLLRSRDEPERVPVASFWMDVRPVTNAEFLAFVRAHPEWARSRARRLFVDSQYLAHWAGDFELGPAAPPDAPVVYVSWFAARAYAASWGARLPSIAEWERAAAVGISTDNARTDPAVAEVMAGWFSRPNEGPLPAVAGGAPNRLGVHDLFGLVWEWVEDFNTALVTGESRADTGLERNLFCGAGSVGTRDNTDYPAFMRAGFRSSLRAAYCVPNLGFRCVVTP